MDLNPIAQRIARRVAQGSGEPASHLIAEDLWLGVIDGTLELGERLPTTRELAVALRVSPRAVERAFAELERRGVVCTRPGEGVFVSLAPPLEADMERHRQLNALCRDTLAHAAELGFEVSDVLEVISDLRRAQPSPHHPEQQP